jgi:branched-chain amino acid transport system permease protein
MTLQTIAQSLANGVGLALVYVLIALGLTLIFSILRIINFAHGEFYMMGGFVAYGLTQLLHVPYLLTPPAAFVIVGLVGIVIERLVFAPLRTAPLNGLIASLGLLWVLQSLAIISFGVVEKEVASPIGGVTVLAGAIVPNERLFVMGSAATLISGLWVFLRFSRHGLALRAVAQDRDAAALQGAEPERIAALAFGIGCALAGVAGALLAPVFFVSPFMGALPVIKAFVVIILGGMGSLSGAVLGGFVLGLTESVAPLIMPAAAVEMLGFLLVIVVLMLRPQGLLGRA